MNQTLGAVRSVTSDETMHEKVLRRVLSIASEMDMSDSPPSMGQRIHRIIREMTGNPDPYKEEKTKYNKFAMSLVPEIKKRIEKSSDPFVLALRLSIAGNIIDFAKQSGLTKEDVVRCIDDSTNVPIDMDAVNELRRAIQEAGQILYMGDNSGEIVFDGLLIQYLPREKITYVVRGSPVINDVTFEDAEEVGMKDLVDVVDNGSDAPGTILADCSSAFQNRFEGAGLVISKGQGNYETLSGADKNVFFLLQAKCPVIARDIRCEIGDFVIAKSR